MKSLLALGVCMGVSLQVFAQETPSADTLATPSTTPEKIALFKNEEVPSDFSELGRTEIITRQQIESSATQTLAGVLSQALNTSVQSSGPMQSFGQVYMRGGSAEGVLILLDGQRMNSVLRETYTLDNIPVTLDMIDHIEIRTGANARQFGEYATNGVINIVTRRDVENNGISVGGFGGTQSNYGGHLIGTYNYKRLDVVASAAGETSSWEDQERTDVKTHLHTQFKATKWMNIFLDGSFVYNHYNMPYMFQRSTGAENMDTYYFRGNFGFDMPVGPRFDLFVKYAYSNFKDQYDPYGYRNTSLDDPFAHYYLNKVVYDRVRNSSFDFGGKYRAKRIDVFFGFNFNSARFMSNDILGDLLNGWTQVPGKPYNFYKYGNGMDSWRLYLDLSLKLRKWYASAGLSINNSTAYENVAFMYGVELGYNVIENKLKVFASFDRAFRNETFFEFYSHSDLFWGNDDPENEFNNQFNLGVKYQDDYSNLVLTGYLSSVKDGIISQLQTSEGYFQYANYSSEKITVMGVEGRYRIDLNRLTGGTIPVTNLSVAFAYNHSNLNDKYSRLTYNYVKYNGQANASVRILRNLSLDVDFSLQQRAGDLVETIGADTTTYKWASLLSARLLWKPQNERYQVYVQGQNLLNQKFYTTSYVQAPQMSILAGVKYNLYVGRSRKNYHYQK